MQLSLLASFKNETWNLREWLEHYVWQGVTRFYLIDNGSTDNPMDVVESFRQSRPDISVFVYSWSAPHRQREHYQKAIAENLDGIVEKSEWILVCDLDEFLFSRVPGKRLSDLEFPSDGDVVRVHERVFGSDGHEKHPRGNIRRAFLHRRPGLGYETKYFFRPQRVKELNIHQADDAGISVSFLDDKIGFNHYQIQSLDFYRHIKMTRGDGCCGALDTSRNMELFSALDSEATCYDDELVRLL